MFVDVGQAIADLQPGEEPAGIAGGLEGDVEGDLQIVDGDVAAADAVGHVRRPVERGVNRPQDLAEQGKRITEQEKKFALALQAGVGGEGVGCR